jgi:hypothetical protein
VQVTGSRPKIVVSADGRGVVGHAGARLLADVADVTGLSDGKTASAAAKTQASAGSRRANSTSTKCGSNSR